MINSIFKILLILLTVFLFSCSSSIRFSSNTLQSISINKSNQPYLGEIAARLLGMQQHSCAIRKGSVWWLRSRLREEYSEILLLNVINPDFI
jgi:hypothetical protein